MHLDDPKLQIRGCMLDDDLSYDEYYSCSIAKKGYSGTAVFVKRYNNEAVSAPAKNGQPNKQTTMKTFCAKKPPSTSTNSAANDKSNGVESTLPIDSTLLTPLKASYAMGIEKHDVEGRIITLDFPLFSLCNVYVPNSGQNLDRLSYRTDEWDKDFFNYIKQMQHKRKVPVLWCGDLNVAHTNLEVWNDGAKHLNKQAGVTPEERQSFQHQLDSGPFIDAFRHLHPSAGGHYSYWSTRAGNRPVNKGLRLDYFICDPSLFDESNQNSKVIVRDSYMDHSQEGSDHCPVILELEIKP